MTTGKEHLVIESKGLHVVIGGSGATGRVIVRELAARGKQVRAVNRSGRAPVPEGAEAVAADATDPASIREACRGASVVYHCAMPTLGKWVELFPPMMEAVIEGAASAGAKLVFADDTWMYGKPEGPMTEDLPYRPVCVSYFVYVSIVGVDGNPCPCYRAKLEAERAVGRCRGPS
jgi:nucleoside-diphosphate-sugar epimerase